MALTRLDLTGDGTTTVYDVAFDLSYLRQEYVYVYLATETYQTQLNYSWLNDTQIQLDTPLASGVAFHIRRVVPRGELVINYSQGAILREDNLDDSNLQNLMIQEEMTDGYINVDGDVIFEQSIDMQSNRVTDMGDAVDPQDALTKSQADAQIEIQNVRDAAQDTWNTQQDNRVTALEQNVPVEGAQYVANYSFTAVGGETVLETNYTFSYAVVAINGAFQTIGKAFNVLGTTLVLAEALEEGDEVAAVLTVPFVPNDEFVGTGDWLYTAVGGETQVDVGLSFTKILLVVNGAVQTPTTAFSAAGTTLFFAEALEEGDELYAMLSA